jgi:hypothetical protein
LKTICQDRGEIFKQDQKEKRKTRNEIKEVWNVPVNGGGIPEWYHNPLAKKVQEEMYGIRRSIRQTNPELCAFALEKKRQGKKYANNDDKGLEQAALRSMFSNSNCILRIKV